MDRVLSVFSSFITFIINIIIIIINYIILLVSRSFTNGLVTYFTLSILTIKYWRKRVTSPKTGNCLVISAIFCIVGAIWWVSFNVVILLRWENIWLNIRHPKQSTFWRQAFRRCCTKHSVTKHLIDNWHKSLFGWKVGLYICPQELSAPRDDQFSGANVTNWLFTSVCAKLDHVCRQHQSKAVTFFFFLTLPNILKENVQERTRFKASIHRCTCRAKTIMKNPNQLQASDKFM